MKYKNLQKNKAFVILYAVTLSAILLAIALGVANIAFREIKFSTSVKDSNDAFFAADTGVEKALFNDKTAGFYSAGSSTNLIVSGLGSTGQSCANVTVSKTTSPVVTTIVSKGYNIADNPAVCSPTNPNRVQREIKTTYGGPSSSCPPASWTAQDIGAGIPGSSCESSGKFTIIGSGSDIWGSSDAFHYAYQSVTGNNIQIIALVTTVQPTDPWAKAGIMIRQDLTLGSSHVMLVATPENGYVMQQRATAGGSSESSASVSGSAPIWLKLVRNGNNFTGYTSTNGTTWTSVTTFTNNNIASSFYIGLAVTSHNNTVSNTSTFDNVSVSTP